VMAAQLWGTVALRLANAQGLPFNYHDYALQVRDYFNESLKTAKRRNLASSFNEKPMMEAIEDFAKEAERVEKARRDAIADIEDARVEASDRHPRAVEKLRRINDALIMVERSLTDARGLRGRPWYVHQIYAPGTYTGYAAQPLPDFRQALDDRNSTNAGEALARIVEALKRATNTLRSARD
jgi:N-acetylated-alpha-linked acidic dipeptidase